MLLALLPFVFAFADSLQDGEAGLFRVTDRQRLRLHRRIELRYDLANGSTAGRTRFEFWRCRWAAQGEFSATDDAVAIQYLVFVKRHTSQNMAVTG